MIKILVAEDEAKSRNALASRLRDIMAETALIETAVDGNDAISKADQIHPDLVFMDIEMPGKNGLTAAMAIRQEFPETAIVFLTAYERFDYAVGALRSGADDYLLKPVSEIELQEVLQRLFGTVAESRQDVTPFEASLNVWIHQHYMEDVALEDAAVGANMSPFYFSRKIKAVTGKTFLEFLTDYRIKKAKERLDSTNMSISEVGRSVGYPDSNYFAKVFKRTVGCTPTAYRTSKS